MMYRPRHRHVNRRTALLASVAKVALALLVLLALAYPFLEPLMLETEYVTLTSADLPRDIGTLRIVYLSDIHYGAFFGDSRLDDLVSRVNALYPDIILLGGDYANDSDGAIAFFEKKPRFHARIAVCGVVGNHDRTIPESNLSRLEIAMFNAGVTPLVNDVTQIRMGSGSIYVAGIDDVNNGHPDVAGVAGKVRRDDYVIFLSHSPAVVQEALRADTADGHRGWFDLGLFGHTHGGQIALFGDALNISDVPRRYQGGWLQENRIDMLVSRGVGTSVLPIRLFCRPQIHVITVKAGS